MKKNYFILLVASLFLVKGFAQQVVEQQRSLIIKRSADWCPYCGTWGWTYFETALEQNADKAVLISAHYDGALSNPAAEEITDNFGGFYQPRFYFNQFDQGVTAGNVQAKLPILKNLVDSAFAVAPIANSGFNLTYSEVSGELQAEAKVKFFQAAQGEFYLGLYLLENNVTAYQASIGNSAVHQRLFRFAFTDETFGKPVVNGDVAAGDEFDVDFSLPISELNGHDYQVAGVIWKKEGDKYLPVNTWSTSQIEVVTVSADHDLAKPSSSLILTPNIASNHTVVQVELADNQANTTLEVFNVNGQKVATLFNGQLAKNAQFDLDREAVGGAGLYLVKLKTAHEVLVQKLIFQ